MTGTEWRAIIIRGGKIFVGLIFVVEGTHENFNITKISVYTVSWIQTCLSSIVVGMACMVLASQPGHKKVAWYRLFAHARIIRYIFRKIISYTYTLCAIHARNNART